MSSSRKTLQILQMAPKIIPGSRNENDGVIKIQIKANTGTISNKSDRKQPSRIALSECKENVGAKLNAKEKVSHSNQLNEKLILVEDSSVKAKTVEEKVPECEKIKEKRTSTSDHDSSFDVMNWMTASEPAEDYWKELAEQRRITLEESLQENEDLYETVDTLNTKIESLNKKVEIQNDIISSQKDQLETQAAEIEKLRELSVEVERLSSILEELTGGLDKDALETGQ